MSHEAADARLAHRQDIWEAKDATEIMGILCTTLGYQHAGILGAALTRMQVLTIEKIKKDAQK